MFIKLSAERFKSQRITIENEFITDYMPYANDLSVKVFLYGLSLATSGMDNSIEMLANKLNVTEDEILSAYKYWEDQGLIAILSLSPPLIEYKEILPVERRLKNYSKAKYKAFNDQLHAMLPNRTILPNEYREYYNAIETLNIEKEAMLTIIAYCIRLKGNDVRYSYILAVARNLAAEGCTAYERVNERLNELDLYGNEIKAVLKALNIKKEADVADKKLWLKWTKEMGFLHQTVIKVAKAQKKGGMEKLDSVLTRYYENRVFSIEEIESFNLNREKVAALTAQIVRTLGRYYERLDYIAETYTQKWINYGFDDAALIKLADHCFRKNIKTLDDMDSVIEDFYKKGLVSAQGIESYKTEAAQNDAIIAGILKKAGIERNVNSWDRDYYRTWTYSWNHPPELIEYAAALSAGRGMPYINGILARYSANKITTLEDAKRMGEFKTDSAATNSVTKKSVEELNALFETATPDDI